MVNTESMGSRRLRFIQKFEEGSQYITSNNNFVNVSHLRFFEMVSVTSLALIVGMSEEIEQDKRRKFQGLIARIFVLAEWLVLQT